MKPLNSSRLYNTFGSYTIDKAKSSLVRDVIIYDCLDQLGHWLSTDKGDLSNFEIKPETKDKYPVESYLFLRVLQRKEDEVAPKTLAKMSPKFPRSEMQHTWDFTIQTTGRPPWDKQFSLEVKEWKKQTICEVYKELQIALQKDKTAGSLKHFTFSQKFEHQILDTISPYVLILILAFFSK